LTFGKNYDNILVEATMKIIKVTKEYYETDDERIYFFQPLETEISVEEIQKILDSNVELLKKLKKGK
jgi:hypothetical protein